jgi:NAD+ kinase
VVVSPFLGVGLEDTWPADLSTMPLEAALKGARLAVTLGGDGTILQISRFLAGSGVPVLGVNMGNKGFLAELEGTELERLLEVADSDFSVLPRMMLDLKLIRGGKTVFEGRALNEAVVRALVSVVRLEALGDGREITEFSGDGIIISTPTGSTAYSMAAGGPIVEPTAENLLLTPMCAHSLTAKPYVLAGDRHTSVRLVEGDAGEALLLVDGEDFFTLRSGDVVHIRKSAYVTRLVKLRKLSFYDVVRNKLM